MTTVLTSPELSLIWSRSESQDDFGRRVEQAVLQSAEVQRLRRLAKALDEKIESYERYGAICEFEGEPMIHAAHLAELRDAAMEKQP